MVNYISLKLDSRSADQEITHIHGTRTFIIVFTKAHHLKLSGAR